MRRVVLFFFITIILAGCVPARDVSIKPLEKVNNSELVREIDDEAGVVCYRFWGEAGIECFLIEDTKLKR